ncbi:MAG: DEAD/DEAH box helicase [Polyangiaceae bacterium]|nr:DEAD/DEAH box helicase [Polyangiaceae bacterium]
MLVSELARVIGPALTGALEKRGFSTLTPVQQSILDPALAGRDLRISSKTGSGKTVAIGLVLRDVVQARPAAPHALVITPTRELAKQVAEELAWLYEPLGATVASLTGGASFRAERRALDDKPGIVVGTPGRLLDYLNRRTLDASQVGAVVLDEADRMLDLGFREDIEAIFAFLPMEHQTHLMSATFSREVQNLADRLQREPARVEGTPLGAANEDISHVIHVVAPGQRVDAIVNLLLATPGTQTVIFAKTRADVSDLHGALRDAGFVIGMLSGEMDQPERNRALADFRRGHVDALVATDVAARGIDVQDIGRVIHAEPPNDVDAYTHRSGRTGRAGRKGTSSVLATPASLSKTERLLARAKVSYEIQPIPTPDQIREVRDERVIERLTTEPDPDPGIRALEEPDEHQMALAERILSMESAKLAIARLLVRARAGGPVRPREVAQIVVPPKRPRHEPRELAPRDRVGARGDEAGGYVLFRISWGQAHGADARRLLAMACRRGGIESRDIGAIRVARTYSTIEVSNAAAASFEASTREPDPRDPRAAIRRAPEDRPAPSPEPKAAPAPERPRGPGRPPPRGDAPGGRPPLRTDDAPPRAYAPGRPPRADDAPPRAYPPARQPRADAPNRPPPRADAPPRGDAPVRPPRADAPGRPPRADAPGSKPQSLGDARPKRPHAPRADGAEHPDFGSRKGPKPRVRRP